MTRSLFPAVLLGILLISLIAVPVSAKIIVTGGNIDIAQTIRPGIVASFSYTAPADEKISLIEYDIPINTVVNFTMTYGAGSTVSGWMIYEPAGIIGQSYSGVAIGDSVYSETFIDAQAAGLALTRHVQFVSYARNGSADPVEGGFAVYAQGYGIFSNEIAFTPIPDTSRNLIYQFDMIATQPITVTVDTTKADILAKYVYSSVGESVTDSVLQIGADIKGYWDTFWSAFTTGVYWLKLIFVDNIILTFAIYFMGTLAYSMLTARNIFDFFRKFFRLQKAIFEFMMQGFSWVIGIITQFINALKPV